MKDLGNDIDPQIMVDAERGQVSIFGTICTPDRHHDEHEICLRDKVKVIIGGAPVSEDFAKSIGADGYGADGFQAVAVVETLSSDTK